MMGALKQGQIVSVMGDRLYGSDKSNTQVDFLGGQATIPFSAYKLASATGAPVVVFFARKDGPKSYQVQLAKVIRVPQIKGRSAETFVPFAQKFAKVLEAFSQQYPYQFYNFHNMWPAQQPPNNKDR
jgi:predicted LPLAT superfamily acyltransferase